MGACRGCRYASFGLRVIECGARVRKLFLHLPLAYVHLLDTAEHSLLLGLLRRTYVARQVCVGLRWNDRGGV